MTDDNRLGSDEAVETQEWLESLEWVLQNKGPERVRQLLEELDIHAQKAGVRIPFSANTPHIPGSREIERRIKSIIRWNAMAMVVRANRRCGHRRPHLHLCSSATLYEVGFNHFFAGQERRAPRRHGLFQGHAAPGIYARAFLEGADRGRSWKTSGGSWPRAAA
jgi:pyruvate dehydrogenase E1 component